MKYNCTIGKIREICFIADNYISDRIKEEQLPILKNHIPLFYILPEDGTMILFNELADKWNISKSSLSDILNKYQIIGLINKCECSEDKRSVYISLTEEAIEVKRSLITIEGELLNLLMMNFTSDERRLFESYIDKALKSGHNFR